MIFIIKRTMEKYTRLCPKCNDVIEYKSKYRCRDAEKEKCVCKKCMHKGKSQKELYGNRYDEIIQKRIKSQKLVKHTWHDKIVESRRKNGTYKLTDEHKKKISNNTIFSKKGKDHVRIKKFLEDNNVTWEEYENKISNYKKYHMEVMYWTRRVNVGNLEHYEKRGKSGIPGAYHLDHIIEISEGFVKNIDPKIISNITNLKFITWEENLKKRNYPGGIYLKN
jgi:hypothetical protein